MTANSPMSINWKRCVKVCVLGVVGVVVVTLLCLLAVSSPRFVNFCAAIMSPSSEGAKSVTRDIAPRTITPPPVVSSSEICTTDVFRRYYRTKDYFPGEGRWTSRRRHGNASAATLYRFVPDLCKFQFDGFRTLPGVNARRCLRRRNVTRVTTLGDSNAARYHGALVEALGDGGWRCVNVTTESIDRTMLMPDVRYFGRHERPLLGLLHTTTRHCSSCVSRVHRCRRQTSNDNRVGTGRPTF